MINLALRGITLGSKFLLSIYLVKFLSLEANGEYGIFVATTSMLTYVLGLDFYSFNNREILQENSLESGKKIKNQFFLFTLVYLLVLPLLYVFGLFDFIGKKYILLFYLILIFDHISIELYRLLVVFSKPIQANMNLFLRTGIWILVLIFAWHYDFKDLKNLKSVFNLWLVGSFLSVVYSIFSISTVGVKIPWKEKMETKWILKGLRIAPSDSKPWPRCVRFKSLISARGYAFSTSFLAKGCHFCHFDTDFLLKGLLFLRYFNLRGSIFDTSKCSPKLAVRQSNIHFMHEGSHVRRYFC